jgi:mRNA-degrading endonuclease RelE of RelBE toxin-antitoxin system
MSYEISIRQAVTAGLDSLDPGDRAATEDRIRLLEELPVDPTELPGVVRVSPRDSYYTLEVTPDLMVYFRVTPGSQRVEVMGLARREAIREFHRRATMEPASS